MPPGGYAFGPFVLDAGANRLLCKGAVVPMPARHVAILRALVRRANEVVTKDELQRAGWGDEATGDNSLAQAITRIRKTLAAHDDQRYIATEPRQGYRFVGTVTRAGSRGVDPDIEALIAPHLAAIKPIVVWLRERLRSID
jgi:DNA-binding winged helix-turn-helix (wHTH) protein